MARPAVPVAFRRTSVIALGAVIAVTGCGMQKPDSHNGGVPTMPTPTPGEATISGLVHDAAGTPVVGAKMTIAETDTSTVTDEAGAFSLTAPSDSTVTLAAFADGFAKTYQESVMLAPSSAATFDVLLLAAADVSADNALAAPDAAATRGVMAIRLHSMAAGCDLTGAHLSIFPPLAASVVYSRPGDSGGIDQPDLAMDGVQAGTTIHAWLVAVQPPGNMLEISIDQAGCRLMAQSPSLDGMMYPGKRRVDAGALTEADLFLDLAP